VHSIRDSNNWDAALTGVDFSISTRFTPKACALWRLSNVHTSAHWDHVIVSSVSLSLCVLSGETPLTCAAYCGHYDAVRALVEEGGADVNMARQDGTTPLNLAAYADAKVGARVCIRLLAQAESLDHCLL
jgi:ankyrin repeat protein